MSFVSFKFLVLFFPIVLAGYFVLSSRVPGLLPKLWLFVASLVFYSAGRIEDFPLLLGSIAINCLFAKCLLRQSKLASLSRRTMLVVGITANVLFLCCFKYAVFFVVLLTPVVHQRWGFLRVVFPLGISFFTIQQIMFLVDCYEGLIEGHNWLDHFVFGGFFPYVTMGPIVRWKQVVPQLNDPRNWRLNSENLARGAFVLVVGLFKKTVLADSFLRWVDPAFKYNHSLSLLGAWIAAVSFTFQMYFDFSGYTDMAMGVALMLNIQLPQNFNAPFRAQSIIEFWRRWHITLTNFITTYLYTPMLRSMRLVTFRRAMVVTFVTMVIAGFWHGPNWTFLLWGALHGMALVLNHCWRKLRWPMPAPIAWLLTFSFVVVGLVIFRSGNIHEAGGVLASMFSLRGGLFKYDPWRSIDHPVQLMSLGWMLCGIAILLRESSLLQLQRASRSELVAFFRNRKVRWAVPVFMYFLTLQVILLFTRTSVIAPFIYRQF